MTFDLAGPETNQSEVAAHSMVLLSDGDHLEMRNTGSEACRFLLIAGQPIREPVVWPGLDAKGEPGK